MGHTAMLKEKKIRDEQCRLNAVKKAKIKAKEDEMARHDILVCKQELERQENQRIERIKEQQGRNVENRQAVMSQFGKRQKDEAEEKATDYKLMCEKREVSVQNVNLFI